MTIVTNGRVVAAVIYNRTESVFAHCRTEGNTDYFVFVDTYIQDHCSPFREVGTLTLTAGAGCGETCR